MEEFGSPAIRALRETMQKEQRQTKFRLAIVFVGLFFLRVFIVLLCWNYLGQKTDWHHLNFPEALVLIILSFSLFAFHTTNTNNKHD